MPKVEDLIKAQHALSMAVLDLRNANTGATALESIVLLDLIKDAADLDRRVAQLTHAITGLTGD